MINALKILSSFKLPFLYSFHQIGIMKKIHILVTNYETRSNIHFLYFISIKGTLLSMQQAHNRQVNFDYFVSYFSNTISCQILQLILLPDIIQYFSNLTVWRLLALNCLRQLLDERGGRQSQSSSFSFSVMLEFCVFVLMYVSYVRVHLQKDSSAKKKV